MPASNPIIDQNHLEPPNWYGVAEALRKYAPSQPEDIFQNPPGAVLHKIAKASRCDVRSLKNALIAARIVDEVAERDSKAADKLKTIRVNEIIETAGKFISPMSGKIFSRLTMLDYTTLQKLKIWARKAAIDEKALANLLASNVPAPEADAAAETPPCSEKSAPTPPIPNPAPQATATASINRAVPKQANPQPPTIVKSTPRQAEPIDLPPLKSLETVAAASIEPPAITQTPCAPVNTEDSEKDDAIIVTGGSLILESDVEQAAIAETLKAIGNTIRRRIEKSPTKSGKSNDKLNNSAEIASHPAPAPARIEPTTISPLSSEPEAEPMKNPNIKLMSAPELGVFWNMTKDAARDRARRLKITAVRDDQNILRFEIDTVADAFTSVSTTRKPRTKKQPKAVLSAAKAEAANPIEVKTETKPNEQKDAQPIPLVASLPAPASISQAQKDAQNLVRLGLAIDHDRNAIPRSFKTWTLKNHLQMRSQIGHSLSFLNEISNGCWPQGNPASPETLEAVLIHECKTLEVLFHNIEKFPHWMNHNATWIAFWEEIAAILDRAETPEAKAA